MESTLTSLGDYDACLNVKSSKDDASDNLAGKYCLIDIFPMKFSNKSDENIFSLEKITIFKYFPFKHSVCLPSSCADAEIQYLLAESLRDYPLIVKGGLWCDTAESISWESRILNLNIHQIISVIFISGVLLITSFATYYHVICKYILMDDSVEKNDLIMCLSCWNNMVKLCTKSEGKNTRFMAFDALKLFTVIVGTMSHFMVALEIPNSYLMLDNHANMNMIFSKSISQTIMNENGLTIFAFLG